MGLRDVSLVEVEVIGFLALGGILAFVAYEWGGQIWKDLSSAFALPKATPRVDANGNPVVSYDNPDGSVPPTSSGTDITNSGETYWNYQRNQARPPENA